jgi:acyl carrier protein
MDDELTKTVIGLVASTMGIAPESITADTTFEQLGMNSLDGLSIVCAVEGEFNIRIPDGSVMSIRSVRETVEQLRAVLAAAKEAQG